MFPFIKHLTMTFSRIGATVKVNPRLAVSIACSLLVSNTFWHSSSQILATLVDRNESTALFAPVERGIGQLIHSNDSQTQIPQWMEDYFQWHALEVSHLNPSNYADKRYLVMRCLNLDDKCGGTSDRLQPIPSILLAAYHAKRLFFIKWEKPYRLEEFLVPPEGGLNWTLPTWLDQKFTYNLSLPITGMKELRKSKQSNEQLIQTRIQAQHKVYAYYDSHRPNGPPFKEMFRDCWEQLFEPSPAVAALVADSTSNLELVRGNYTAVHIRSKYLVDRTQNEYLVRNAINCGSQLSSEQPIYIAADDKRAIEYAMSYGSSKGGVVVGRLGEEPILHVDRGSDFLTRNEAPEFPVSAYYGTFVDFYMMVYSSCLSLHIGGFGRWANRLRQNSSCLVDHGKNNVRVGYTIHVS